MFFNCLILFVLLNVALQLGYVLFKQNYRWFVNSKQLMTNPVSRKYGNEHLRLVYPDKTQKEIDDLLNEFWTVPLTYEAFTQFKERPRRGSAANVDPNGFRFSKNKAAWPPDPKNFNVFLFGGSTTFGYGVPDDQTIASYLGENLLSANLTKKPCVYNFGRSTYYSTQERILFEKLLTGDFVPNVAIFIDGLNDFYYKIKSNEPVYTGELTEFFEANSGRNSYFLIQTVKRLPLFKAVAAIRKALGLTGAEDKHDQARREVLWNDPAYYDSVIRRYSANKKLIEAAAASFGVKTVFVWQPVPYFKSDAQFNVFAWPKNGRPTLRPANLYELGYPLVEKKMKENFFGDNFLWLADTQDGFTEQAYVDGIHYSAAMSKRLAGFISEFMKEKII